MPLHELQLENAKLRRQIAEAHAAIADRDAKIEQLAKDVATLQAAVKHLLSGRRGKYRIPQGQGLLFPESERNGVSLDAEATASDEGDDKSPDDEPPRKPRSSLGTKRTPGKIDTTGLLRVHRVHDVPEDQRIDSAAGKPLVQIGVEDSRRPVPATRRQARAVSRRARRAARRSSSATTSRSSMPSNVRPTKPGSIRGRAKLRQEKAKPILFDIDSRAWRLRGQFVESLVKAISYLSSVQRFPHRYAMMAVAL